ncbi:MAG TPA: hypothetical protein VMF12_17500 [Xanthobacteraceae bacterium]|nr:hypothetical protein [Xanthobacteraceae bacterium]
MQLGISASIFAPGGFYRATLAGTLNEAFSTVYAFALSAAEPILTVLVSFFSAAAFMMLLRVQSRMACQP